jgi:hypothetical protein
MIRSPQFEVAADGGPGRAKISNLLNGIAVAHPSGVITTGMSTKPGTMLATGLCQKLQ